MPRTKTLHIGSAEAAAAEEETIAPCKAGGQQVEYGDQKLNRLQRTVGLAGAAQRVCEVDLADFARGKSQGVKFLVHEAGFLQQCLLLRGQADTCDTVSQYRIRQQKHKHKH